MEKNAQPNLTNHQKDINKKNLNLCSDSHLRKINKFRHRVDKGKPLDLDGGNQSSHSTPNLIWRVLKEL